MTRPFRILAIEDQPIRLGPLMERGWDIFVAWHPELVDIYLDNYDFGAVLLDHDMPVKDGLWFARWHLLERNIPVLVHSANDIGAGQICALLAEYEVPHERLSFMEPRWHARASAWLLTLRDGKVDPKTLTPKPHWTAGFAEAVGASHEDTKAKE